jgi:hypothetical protein
VLSTSGYVGAVTPVVANPAVHAAVQGAVTSQLDAALSRAESSLPPAARALAGPLGTALAGFAGNETSVVMASQAFQRLWADVNRLTHSELIRVLNGDSTLVSASGGEVVLNLLPLVNDVLHSISGRRHLAGADPHTAGIHWRARRVATPPSHPAPDDHRQHDRAPRRRDRSVLDAVQSHRPRGPALPGSD